MNWKNDTGYYNELDVKQIIKKVIEDICSHQCTSDCRREGCNCIHEGTCIDQKEELTEEWL